MTATLDALTLLGAVLMAALLMSVAARLLSIPKVSGYLVAGLLLGSSGLNLVHDRDAQNLSLIGRIAIALILFDIGGEFELETLRKHGRRSAVASLLEISVTLALVGLLLSWAGAPPALALLVACVALETSPSATILVVKELQAHGPVTTFLLGVVAFDVLFAIAAMHLSLAGLGITTWMTAFRTLGGAIALGLIVGKVLGSIGSRLQKETELLLFAFSTLLLTQGLARQLRVSAMLTTMVSGAVAATYPDVRSRIFDILKPISGLLYAVLFVTAGARLHLSMLANIGGLGIAYLVGRACGKLIGGSLGAHVTRADGERSHLAPIGLLSHAGVAIGLTMTLGQHAPVLAETASVIVLAAIVPFEIVGPIGASVCLRLAGEAGQQTDVLDLDVVDRRPDGESA